MELRHRIGTYAKQTMAISSQVIQSIVILQYDKEQLDEFLRDQAERNPLIEVVPGAATSAPPSHALQGAGRGSSAGGGAVGGRAGQLSGAAPDLEQFCVAPVTLADHLSRQAGMTFTDATDRIVAHEIIGSLDTDGYLRRNLAELSRRLGASVESIEAVLSRIQQFEPAGVAARSLGECLSIQLREADRLDSPMERLLQNLPLLANFEYKQLAAQCGVPMERVAEMAREIRALNPRPGRQFDSSPVQPALPDVLVTTDGAEGFRVELNSALMPRVLVNRQYCSSITSARMKPADRRYVVDCMKTANWLVRNLDHRAQTILKVATEIVAQQMAFFHKGVEHLRPMSLRDVAVAIGVHESTVCRAIANKYMMTDRGMFEMKYFFAIAISSVDGEEDHSAEMVRHQINALIRGETAKTVLSDEAIVHELRKSGVDIARRTIAKYRDAMNIPSSLQRKRQKMAAELV